MNVADLLTTVAGARAGHPALIDARGRRVAYGDLLARVDHAVGLLRDAGLTPGDRVLLAVPSSVATYVAMLAVLRAGLVVMAIDPGHGTATLRAALRAQPPAAIIGTRLTLLLSRLLPEGRRIRRRFAVGAGGMCTAACAHAAAEPRHDADPALLTFTSGSTGTPKAVIRTHGFLRTQIDMLDQVAQLSDDDIDLVTMPMFVLFNLSRGVTSLLPASGARRPGRANADRLVRQLVAERATRMIVSPALLARIVTRCAKGGHRLRDLRVIATGGGPVSPQLAQRLRPVMPNAILRCVYGSTEAEPIACIDDASVSAADHRRMCEGAGLLVGRPVAGCRIRIIDSRPGSALGPFTSQGFAGICLPAGSIGEIAVSGRHVLEGYADPELNGTGKIEVDGTRWHRTGDAGYVDDHGRLWLVGRCAGAIRDRRGELYPFQVEYAAATLPGIRRAAVMGRDGRRILAVETSRGRFGALSRQLARHLAGWHVDRIVRLRRIPMDRRHDAKVDYPALERRLQSAQ